MIVIRTKIATDPTITIPIDPVRQRITAHLLPEDHPELMITPEATIAGTTIPATTATVQMEVSTITRLVALIQVQVLHLVEAAVVVAAAAAVLHEDHLDSDSRYC